MLFFIERFYIFIKDNGEGEKEGELSRKRILHTQHLSTVTVNTLIKGLPVIEFTV